MASATPDLRLSSSRKISVPCDGTKLYCLVTEAYVCEQLAQGHYLTAARPGIELATSRVASQHLNHYTTRPHKKSPGCSVGLRSKLLLMIEDSRITPVRWCHLYSAGRPSHWASAHILVFVKCCAGRIHQGKLQISRRTDRRCLLPTFCPSFCLYASIARTFERMYVAAVSERVVAVGRRFRSA